MKVNFEKLLEKLSKKLETETEPNPMIGATIKTKRKSLDKTLDEVSQRSGVSLSYISKIENDLLNPNFKKIRRVLSELNLNEDIFDYSSNMSEWYSQLLDIMLGLNDDETVMKAFIRKRDDFQSKLIDLALHVKRGSLKHCETHISLLMNSIDQMMPIELGIFMLSIAHYYFMHQSYIQSAKMMDVALQRQLNHKKLILWQDDLLFQLSLLTNNVLYINERFAKLTVLYQNYGLMDKAYDLRLSYHQHMQFIAGPNFYDLDDFDNQIETKKFIFMNQLFCCSKTVVDVITDEPDLKPYNLILALAYDKIENGVKAVYYLEQIDETDMSKHDQILHTYLKHKYQMDDYEAHLKHALFKDPNIYHNDALLSFYGNACMNHYKSQHRYKECVLIQEAINRYKHEIRFHFEKIYSK
ncbi:MAG: helix-turn-helix transcriptional regulator [Acholeplasma sp.]|jgi:transcriptional regulator with XRE-family HTH domain|nr:helix-turn-helix transcriptional regulator [Acholeplasma sp.]